MTAKNTTTASTQVTARLSESLLERIDRAARRLKRTRADVIRQALEYYLDDVEDLDAGLAALRDPADPVVDWNKARARLLRRKA